MSTALEYLGNRTWGSVTREERYFCAKLFEQIENDPTGFVRWLASRMSQEGKAFDTTGPWDAGYEVCFYRDLLAANRRLAHEVWVKDKKFYSQKRTFDIALFSPKVIIAIEAKAAQSFDSKQKDSIELDKTRLRSFVSKLFPAVEVPQLFFVALTQERITVPENLFRHQITWASLARECPVIDESCRSVLERAEVVRARFG